MKIRECLKKIRYGKRASSDEYISFLRQKGAKVGVGTKIYAPRNVEIDVTRPYLIDIGEYNHITYGVTILTHGYDWAILRGKYGKYFGSAGRVKTGNNVFIGSNTTILKGVTIGDNVIIGAGSLVNHDIPSDCVAAGNPAHIICSIEDYYKKREEACVKDAKEVVHCFFERYHKIPPIEELFEFFWLFEKRDLSKLPGYSGEGFNHKMRKWEFYQILEDRYYETKPKYDSYEDFIIDCHLDIKEDCV